MLFVPPLFIFFFSKFAYSYVGNIASTLPLVQL